MARPSKDSRSDTPSEYSKNLAKLMKRVKQHLSVRYDTEVYEAYRLFMQQWGLGGLSLAKSSTAIYFGSAGRIIATELTPRGELGVAAWMQSLFAKEDPRWGTVPVGKYEAADFYTPLVYLREILKSEKGPVTLAGIEKLIAAHSPTVAATIQSFQGMNSIELIDSARAILERLEALLPGQGSSVPEPEPELEELPCDPKNPVWLTLQATMKIGPELTREVIVTIAEKTELPPARVRALVCGELPTDAEIAQLSRVAEFGAESFREFLQLFIQALGKAE